MPRSALVAAIPLLGLVLACGAPGSAPQNPSPMVETARRHRRLSLEPPPGRRLDLDAGLGTPVRLFIPPGAESGVVRLLVHFHGAAAVAEHAIADRWSSVGRSGKAASTSAVDPAVSGGAGWVLAVINLGAGSSRYERPFRDPAGLRRLVDAASDALGSATRVHGLYLSGFSAGCGALRGILSTAEGRAWVDGVIFLDGIHTGYDPPGRVLDAGGRLEAGRLEGILAFARDAVAGRKTMLVTHSEIFPGTYASTTETADWLLERIGLVREPVLEWGPGGMQRLSVATAGRFLLYGFAGNTAPDHVDHLHGLGTFLEELP